MNFQKVAERLGITQERLEGLQETILKRASWPEPRLMRFEKAISGIESGTAIFESNEIVFGYPKIRRAMMLGPALKRHFRNRVVVEEKMNGYNIRLASVAGEVVALTRGGFICPFSTEVANRLIPNEVFEENPMIVLCGEIVGPENPYVPKGIYPTNDIDFYLFDLSKKNCRGTLGPNKTHQFAEDYGIKAAALFGEFRIKNAYEKIMGLVKQLGRRGREGVVIKDPDNERSPMKYTTSETNCHDLEIAFRYYNDYALDFFLSRAVREGFQSVEWAESAEDRLARARRLGESILLPLVETIQQKKNNEQIVQQVQIRVKSLQTAREFEYHLRRSGLRAIFDEPEPDDDGYIIRISRLIMSTNDKTQSLLEGSPW
ncbi:MAG: RNA ligase [Methanotrichaceae archaeon]|nr:RNA ligase [Methanotrichaceae archaeon]